MAFSRILLLSLPLSVWSNDVAGDIQSLSKFKEEYQKELPDQTSALKKITFNSAIQGASSPSDADAKNLWEWYSAVSGTVKTEAKAVMDKMEKDGLVHQLLLSEFVTKLNTAIAQTAVVTDAKNYEALMKTETPAAGHGIAAETVAAHELLKVMNAADKAQANAFIEARMYGSFTKAYDGYSNTLNDYQKITQNFAQTLATTQVTGAHADDVKGKDTWDVYSRVPAAMQDKIRAYMLEKLKAKIAA